jgi:hypothetical protein
MTHACSSAREVVHAALTPNNQQLEEAESQWPRLFVHVCLRALRTLQKCVALTVHPTNGDEELYPSRIDNFHKMLPHNSIGEV